MKHRYNTLSRVVSLLLIVAMLMTMPAFSIFAEEVVENMEMNAADATTIENIDAMYIYSFWWNANETEICYMKGKELLQYLSATSMLDRLERIISECCTDFVSIAFGEETAFNYCKCTQKMVETSHNIVFWLFKKCDAFKSISSLQKISDMPMNTLKPLLALKRLCSFPILITVERY